jgi:hypothetical protein
MYQVTELHSNLRSTSLNGLETGVEYSARLYHRREPYSCWSMHPVQEQFLFGATCNQSRATRMLEPKNPLKKQKGEG